MPKRNAKTNMLQHSRAKVDLYRRYLSIYLSILGNTNNTKNIHIFDLFCGEGVYEDGLFGSPIAALDAIEQQNIHRPGKSPNIHIWLNDSDKSAIEPDVMKIDRVREIITGRALPNHVHIDYFQEDFRKILPKAKAHVDFDQTSKNLFFIDPYDYKTVSPRDIKEILVNRNSEIILFFPAVMAYRFAEAATREYFSGSAPLRNYMRELFGNQLTSFGSVYDFIEQVKIGFRRYLGNNRTFVDTFILESAKNNVYCLFFFTDHIRGFEKMLEAKWRLDQEQGRGFRIDAQQSNSMFGYIETSGYIDRLLDYVTAAPYRTNTEIWQFGLEQGFLPKHTGEVLASLCDHTIERFSLDGRPVRGYYLEYRSDRNIGYRIKRRN